MPRPAAKFEEKVEHRVPGQFLLDCAKECGASRVDGWSSRTADKEFLRYTQWVRRVIEECNWWELNGGGKNINSHLQVRLLTTYKDLLPLVNPNLLHRFAMVSSEGQAPKDSRWDAWYHRRAIEADKWYAHWCGHIQGVKGETFGTRANTRLMKMRTVWQLFKNKPHYTN